MNNNSAKLEIATLGSGCFWCTEAFFQNLKGVQQVKSGYSGGFIKKPAYREVCNGVTGHAEVVQIEFDPAIIAYSDLLKVFWETHDPTTLNQQGNDVGTQYRSAIFYHSEQQKATAEAYKSTLNESKAFAKPIVTEITAFKKFYEADNIHQEYFNLNGEAPYCQFVIKPKLEKFEKANISKLNPDYLLKK